MTIPLSPFSLFPNLLTKPVFPMALNSLFYLTLLFMFSAYNSCFVTATVTDSQSQFFSLMKNSLEGNDTLTKWEGSDYCNYTGISCDDSRNVVRLDITRWSLYGKFPDDICDFLPRLNVLRIGNNNFHGGFPHGISNCTFLEELNTSAIHFTGKLPDFFRLKSLRVADLSYNRFSGEFPISITNLTDLELLDFNENKEFSPWQLPESFLKLTKLKKFVLSSCNLHGRIPPFLGNMTTLIDLELSGNKLIGTIPKELALLRNLQQLELYYNFLDGEIPHEIGNLTQLWDLDMSVNKFRGGIPESFCRLPKIQFIQLYNSTLTGSIPACLANSTTLVMLSLYGNYLTGQVPENLGRSSALRAVDLSENNLTGRLPEGLCSGGSLKYLLVLKNMFSGKLPETYSDCKSLIRFRVSNNLLEGDLPEGILSLPHASIIDLAFNDFTGSISSGIRFARNLSELFVQGNRISGEIPQEISLATNLVKIDFSSNLLSGPIPAEIGKLKRLNLLLLQGNMLSSSIPESLSKLTSLNLLDLSSNSFSGNVPEDLSKLLPNSLNFSNNHLSGPIPIPFINRGLLDIFSGNPGLCVPANVDSSGPNFPICSQSYSRKKINGVWLIAFSLAIIAVGTVLYLKRWLSKHRKVTENEDTLSSSFCSFDVKNFHRLSFDQREIIESLVDKNIVGYGGSGTVYKIELNSGDVVAVKKLWSHRAKYSASDDDELVLDKELKTEVETLGSIRHKNIVKLYCYFTSVELSLLVYEYMPNGNLWDALHKGKGVLDWPIRHQIALGVAQGLAYLHHDIMPPIIHRDIKSTNILLDEDYLPKVADFGIAKVLQARGSMDSSTTVVAGTYGYLAPEYAYSSKTTTKCDVYSFGVVLMELITGKKPVEAEFGENKNIIYWVSTKIETKEGAMEVLDKQISDSYKDEMIKVLRIAIRCTCRNAVLRPSMTEVAQLLIEADPCRFDCCTFPNKQNTGILTKPL